MICYWRLTRFEHVRLRVWVMLKLMLRWIVTLFLHTKWLASFFSVNPLVTIKMPKGYNISLQSSFSWYFFLLERISHIQNVTWTEQTLQIIIPLHIIIRIELKLFSSNKLNKNPQQILSRRTVHVRKGCLPTRNKNSMKKQRKSYFKHV